MLKIENRVPYKFSEEEIRLEKLEAHEKYIMDRNAALSQARKEGFEEGKAMMEKVKKLVSQLNLDSLETLFERFDDASIASAAELKIEDVEEIRELIEREQIRIAKNLLDILDDETISNVTGLKLEKVKDMR